ncbi:HNH endonuclease [Methylobacterium sp. P1-11]|nr:HNH endonuclease [Methylobacterium sp. P1-11]
MSGCWLWTGTLHHDGYGQIRIGGVTERAHRLSYRLHCGEIPDGLGVLHHCDTRCCVNPDHLYVGTAQQNNADIDRRDRRLKGAANAASKLSEKTVREIRASLEQHTVIARRYGVTRQAIAAVRSGKAWGHVR